MPVDATPQNAWAPLKQPLFRALWTASVVSNIGTWMQNVGVAWLMTSMAPRPLMVSLVQTAATLPVFIGALPAGALADVVDRRRLLLLTQGWMLGIAGVLGLMTLAGMITPYTLLFFTFLMGMGDAMNGPAWASITPEIIPRAELPAALGLNSAGYNVARAIGPALGGLVVASIGSGQAFLFNAASFVAVLAVLYRWRRAPRQSMLPAEQVAGAMRSGLRYVRHSPPVKAVLVRSAAFLFAASALWALLPLVALRQGQGSLGYGGLLGCMGLGAVGGAGFLPRLRRQVGVDWLSAGATVAFAVVMMLAPVQPHPALLYASMVVAGGGWLTMMVSLNVAVQISTPYWVRARALAVYILVFQGALALGSVFWGAVAKYQGIPYTLATAGALMLLGLTVVGRYPLEAAEGLKLDPSMHWPELSVLSPPEPDHGPVLVTVEYRVDPKNSREFSEAMRAVGRTRKRDGAIQWGLFRDTADPWRHVETFVVESWAEHMRQHERATVADREIEALATTFHVGEAPPRTSHLIFSYERESESWESL
jgi:MFS family permease/quinol monooxygenase YgiN